MENIIRQHVIEFVESTLNECETFSKVFGNDFVRNKFNMFIVKIKKQKMNFPIQNGEFIFFAFQLN